MEIRPHIDYLITDKLPQFPVCILSETRPNSSTVRIMKAAGITPFVYVNEKSPYFSEYQQIDGINLITCPTNGLHIAHKRQYIVDHQRSLGQDYMWQIDDDIEGFYTKGIQKPTKVLIPPSIALSSAEALFDSNRHVSVHFTPLLDFMLIFKTDQYVPRATYWKETPKQYSGFVLLLNIKMMEEHGIKYNPNNPTNFDDIELHGHFAAEQLPVLRLEFISFREEKIPSVAFNDRIDRNRSVVKVCKFINETYNDEIYYTKIDKKGLNISLTPVRRKNCIDFTANMDPEYLKTLPI